MEVCQTADLTKVFKIYGKEWKFCPKFKSLASRKEGIFQLSHWAKDHPDGYGQQNTSD